MHDEDLKAVSVGFTGEVDLVMSAYRAGLFPMGLGDDGGSPMGWWAPTVRGVLLPGGLRVSRSLRRSMRDFTFTVDQSFPAVVAGCADTSREGSWITEGFARMYDDLHAAGWAHSVEVRDADGALVGGLFGISFGAVFVGESMFHAATDASKAALVHLSDLLDERCGDRWMVDVQWTTEHLESLGVSELTGLEYLDRLHRAEGAPDSEAFFS
ncbi:MAG: leucyl/phenylalanyl-tRNA--protein transferase [Brevibacterium yomogidense]